MKKILLLLLILLLIFIAYLLVVTLTFNGTQLEVDPVARVEVSDGAVDRFTEAISIRTVSFEDQADFDSVQFEKFNQFLVESYPLINSRLDHKVFGGFSHLYHWKGTDSTLKPIVLMAHHDVVPIATPSAWSVHPFTAGLVNDTIYGRGSIDCKYGLVGLMESTEMLLKEGFRPKRDIYLSFGHDEEILGKNGAVKIAEYLHSKGIKAHFVMDEGLAITDGLVPGVEGDVALIGIAEKGFLSLELTVAMAGGHSSTPASETSIDVLSRAVSALKQNPSPASLNPVVNAFLERIGPEMEFLPKLVVANRAILKPVLLNDYQKSNNGNAMIRTTTSPTIFQAGIKENVIPTVAQAIVNFRLIPGEKTEDVIKHVKKVVDDIRVNVETYNPGTNPSPVSPIDNEQFAQIEKSIRQIYPSTKVAPSLVLGGTDSKYFTIISDNIYRFSPYIMSNKNLTCYHGINERVPKVEFENGIRFYRQLIINSTK